MMSSPTMNPLTPEVLAVCASGFAISLLIGHVGVVIFRDKLRDYMGAEQEEGLPGTKPVPNWLLGMVERSFFTILVALDVAGYAVTMIAWLGVKMAASWTRVGSEDEGKAYDIAQRGLAVSALVVGLISMGFALAGGLICWNALWVK